MDKLITLFGFKVNAETKARTVANIEKQNSRLYKSQVAKHEIAVDIIDNMLNDPFWREVIAESLKG